MREIERERKSDRKKERERVHVIQNKINIFVAAVSELVNLSAFTVDWFWLRPAVNDIWLLRRVTFLHSQQNLISH